MSRMHKVVALLAIIAAGISSAAAQNTTDPNCPPVIYDFSTIADNTSPMSIGFQDIWCGKNTHISGGQLIFTLNQECGPNIGYEKQIQEGKVDLTLTTGWSSGVVTAFTLIADAPKRDEVDIEWVGKEMTQMQTMYFVKGERVPGAEGGGIHELGFDTSQVSKTYSIEYTKAALNWFVDGTLIRTVENTGDLPYPDQPLQLNLGIWDGSDTGGWAGNVSWANAVNGGFQMKVSKLVLTPYTCDNFTVVAPKTTSIPVHHSTNVPQPSILGTPVIYSSVAVAPSKAPVPSAANTMQSSTFVLLFNMMLTLITINVYAKFW